MRFRPIAARGASRTSKDSLRRGRSAATLHLSSGLPASARGKRLLLTCDPLVGRAAPRSWSALTASGMSSCRPPPDRHRDRLDRFGRRHVDADHHDVGPHQFGRYPRRIADRHAGGGTSGGTKRKGLYVKNRRARSIMRLRLAWRIGVWPLPSGRSMPRAPARPMKGLPGKSY